LYEGVLHFARVTVFHLFNPVYYGIRKLVLIHFAPLKFLLLYFNDVLKRQEKVLKIFGVVFLPTQDFRHACHSGLKLANCVVERVTRDNLVALVRFDVICRVHTPPAASHLIEQDGRD